MTYDTRTYSSKESSVTFNGSILLGFTPDNAVNIVRNADFTDEEVGLDGFDVISVNPNSSCLITLNFQQESQGHRMLSDFALRQQRERTLVRAPLIIRTTNERIVIPKAHLKTWPELGWGSTATGSTRPYVFWGLELNPASADDFRGSIGDEISLSF